MMTGRPKPALLPTADVMSHAAPRDSQLNSPLPCSEDPWSEHRYATKR